MIDYFFLGKADNSFFVNVHIIQYCSMITCAQNLIIQNERIQSCLALFLSICLSHLLWQELKEGLNYAPT